MYGKIFATMFTGSMYGAGPVMFSVWAYVLANMDEDGSIELNPRHLAPIIGCSINDVRNEITKCCEPDLESRSQEEDGRRLLHTAGFLYWVVNSKKYQEIKKAEDRKKQNRDAQQKVRDRGKEISSADRRQSSADVNKDHLLSAESAHIDIPIAMSVPVAVTENKEVVKEQKTIGFSSELKDDLLSNEQGKKPGTPKNPVPETKKKIIPIKPIGGHDTFHHWYSENCIKLINKYPDTIYLSGSRFDIESLDLAALLDPHLPKKLELLFAYIDADPNTRQGHAELPNGKKPYNVGFNSLFANSCGHLNQLVGKYLQKPRVITTASGTKVIIMFNGPYPLGSVQWNSPEFILWTEGPWATEAEAQCALAKLGTKFEPNQWYPMYEESK